MQKKIVKLFLTVFMIFSLGIFAEAAELNTDAMLQYNQGIDFYKIGQYDEAINCFKEAIRLDPNYIDAYYNLGSVYEYLQQYDAALPVFKQIIVRKPDDYDSIYKAAWISVKLNDTQRAATYLSIIPPTSERYNDARLLAQQMNMPINRVATEQKSPKTVITQTNKVFNEIAAPTGITSDREGNVYIAEFNTNSIIKITPDEKKIVFLKNPQISGPIGIAFDKSGNLYIANYNKDNILKLSTSGELSVLISNVKKPYYLYIQDGMLFASCQGSDSVLKYKLAP